MGYLEDQAHLQDRVAIVVGGGSGIGAAVVLALAAAGMHIAFCDINAAAVTLLHGQLNSMGRRIVGVVADATDPAALKSFFAEVSRVFGQADVLVNVVGGVRQKAFTDSTAAEWAADIHRNYGYVLESVREAVLLMRSGGRGGSIINFSTIEATRGAAGFSVYAGAKAAVVNFSRSMAVELGPEGIRVNVLAPDTTPSEGNVNAMPPEVLQQMATIPPEWMSKALRMYIPLGSPPSGTDLANTVVFLASDLSKSVTGTTLHVDGGTWAASGFINWPESQGFLPIPLAALQRRLFGP